MRQECGITYQTLWMVRVYCCVICGWYIYADVYCVCDWCTCYVRMAHELHVGWYVCYVCVGGGGAHVVMCVQWVGGVCCLMNLF